MGKTRGGKQLTALEIEKAPADLIPPSRLSSYAGKLDVIYEEDSCSGCDNSSAQISCAGSNPPHLLSESWRRLVTPTPQLLKD